MATTFKTRLNAKPSKPEVIDNEQLTVPDASKSLRQIYTDAQRGIITTPVRQGVYNENHRMLPLDHYDFTEIDEFKREAEAEKTLHIDKNEKIEKIKIRKANIQAKKVTDIPDSQSDKSGL